MPSSTCCTMKTTKHDVLDHQRESVGSVNIDSIRKLGFDTCLSLNPRLLVPDERIWKFCKENKCGQYDAHHMCPPRVGPIQKIAMRLQKFSTGILIQKTTYLNVKEDEIGLKQTKMDFHHKILRTEEVMSCQGYDHVWGVIGGNCALCEPCKAKFDEPCAYSQKARPSLESMGIDVIGLLDTLVLDSAFHADRVTWTGCVLYSA